MLLGCGVAASLGVAVAAVMALGPNRAGTGVPPAAPLVAPVAPQPTRRADPGPSKPQSATPPAGRTYTVAPGDTLAKIALRHGVPVEQLAAENGIRNVHRIRPGQQIRIGQRPRNTELIQPGTTLSDYAARHGVSVSDLLAVNPQITNPNRINAGGMLRLPAVRR